MHKTIRFVPWEVTRPSASIRSSQPRIHVSGSEVVFIDVNLSRTPGSITRDVMLSAWVVYRGLIDLVYGDSAQQTSRTISHQWIISLWSTQCMACRDSSLWTNIKYPWWQSTWCEWGEDFGNRVVPPLLLSCLSASFSSFKLATKMHNMIERISSSCDVLIFPLTSWHILVEGRWICDPVSYANMYALVF